MSPKTIALASTGLIAFGCLLAALAHPVAIDVIAIFIGGVGLVGLISSAFLAVGQSEDRARERDRDRDANLLP